MRYIGNKTKLLPFILRTLDALQIRAGSAHDAFAGTASVGRALKEAGWRVASSDTAHYSYVFQRAYVVASGVPPLAHLIASDADLRRALRQPALRERANGEGRLALLGEYLAHWIEPESGFISRHFSQEGGRMYFTPENAQRIDAARVRLQRWRDAGVLGEDAYYVLLAAIIEGADRVANTAGVYAAYIKQWQPNAVRAFTIEPEEPIRGRPGSTAHCADAAETAASLGRVDLLYIDPPYNNRQYVSYYHIPEILALGWAREEPQLRGRVGLLVDKTAFSRWCSSRRGPRELRHLLAVTQAQHVLVSYNEEGILSPEIITDALAEAAVDGKVRRFSQRYKRYRADSDRAGRSYRRDEVSEHLYYARLR